LTEPVFRRANRDDVPAIVRLLADDELGRGRERIEDPLPAAYGEAFDRIDADARNLLIVGELDGEVVATLQMTFVPGLSNQGAERALIEAVRVASARRSGGIGARMVDWAITEARRRSCRSVQLFTHESRKDAQRFYARLGLQPSHVGMRLPLD
jgi:GNAT superfamily N-acetyltransferase